MALGVQTIGGKEEDCRRILQQVQATTKRTPTDNAEELESLEELQASFPCVGCDEKHRFTARLPSNNKFVVMCPKWHDSELIAELWRKTKPKQPKKAANEGRDGASDGHEEV